MKKITITLPTIDEVNFSITAEQDDIPVRGNAVVSGDEEVDKKIEDEIIERLENGDVWAWASVQVTAEFKGITGNAYLGACSYKSEKDFVEAGDYYIDMKREAYDNLISELEDLQD